MRWSRLFGVLYAAVAVLGAIGQSSSNAAEPEIIVRGTTAKDARAVAGKFTRSVAGGPIARWDNWLCFSVQGLSADQSAIVLSRIKEDAADVGIRAVDDSSCTWNVLIAFTTDADRFSAKLVKDHPGLFRDYHDYGLASHHERNVLAAPRPVRWLAVERSVSAVGSGAGVPDEEGSHINDSSHITTNIRGEKTGELIIVDPQRASGVSWQQLADYLSMVILTDPGMDEQFADNRSIMSIFAARDRGEQGPPELTSEDRHLLKGYYLFDPYATTNQQVGTIIASLKAGASSTDGARTAP